MKLGLGDQRPFFIGGVGVYDLSQQLAESFFSMNKPRLVVQTSRRKTGFGFCQLENASGLLWQDCSWLTEERFFMSVTTTSLA